MENTNSSTVNDLLGQIDRSLEQISWLQSFAAQRIDPETAEVKCEYSWFLDPYGITQMQCQQLMPHYFARSPGSDIWVAWDDLPYEIELRLWRKHKQRVPVLCEPTSCWASFVNSRYFQEDEATPGVNVNHVNYIRQRTVGKLKGE
jgi:hypothetical protein